MSDRRLRSSKPRTYLAGIFGGTILVLCLVSITGMRGATGRLTAASLLDPPNYLTWYTPPPASPWPAPIPSAYAGIGGALGAANMYNATSGLGMLGVAPTRCYFVCYGGPGAASHHFLAYGNDVNTGGSTASYTHHGAADDCNVPPKCPGGIRNQVFAVTANVTPAPFTDAIFASVDGSGNFGVLANLYASGALVAGAGIGTPAPFPTHRPGALVSFVGISPARGEVLWGSETQFARCDYGEATRLVLTCNQPVVISSGGIRPNDVAGGYVPETLPNAAATPNPTILSGTCSVSGSSSCAFPGGFSFPDTSYNCSVSAQGTTPIAATYAKTSVTEITINSSLSVTTPFSYICMG